MKIDRLRDILNERPDVYDLATVPDSDFVLEIIDDYLRMYSVIVSVIDFNPPTSRTAIALISSREKTDQILMQL